MAATTELPMSDVRVGAGTASLGPRLLWLALGAAISLLAVGGRWDIALAAWFAPVFLLRFSRTSGATSAIAGIALVSSAQVAWLFFEYGVSLDVLRVGLSVCLGVLYAIPYALDRLLADRLGANGRIFLLPVAAVVVEFGVASLLPTGASVGTRVNTQSENLALVQVVSVFGPHVIGFLIACAATVANHIWENPSRRVVVGYGGSFLLALLSIVAFGHARLAYAGWKDPDDTVTVAGIMPRMALRQPASRGVSMSNYPPSAQTTAALSAPDMTALYAQLQTELLDSTRKAAKAGAQIVVWSETAAQMLDADKRPFLDRVATVAREEGVYVNVAIGVPFERNETFLIGPDGNQQWHYRKNQPVPGMEPVAPFENDVPVVETPFGRLTNVICYDADFPRLSRVAADIMLLPGWDWPEAGYVHTMKVARLRAIENGYSMIRVDYNGVSAAFDPYGRVLAMQNTLRGENYTMMVDLPIKGVPTLYNRVGDVFAWLCVAATLALSILGIVRPAPSEA